MRVTASVAPSQPPAQELQQVRVVLDALVDALPAGVSAGHVVVQQHRVVAVQRLHERRHLPGMERIDARVRVAGHEHHDGILHARLHPLVGRVRAQPVELLGIGRRAVFGHPELGDQEAVVAQHVEQRHLAEHGAVEVGPLRHRRAHQQPAVAAAVDPQPLALAVTVRQHPLRDVQEVVEDVLLVREHAVLVPGLAELRAAAQVRGHVDAAQLEPRGDERRERGRDADVEPAVAAQQHLVRAVERRALRATTKNGTRASFVLRIVNWRTS
jgi:hypothetical protein